MGAGLMWAFGSRLGPAIQPDVEPLPREPPEPWRTAAGAPAALPAVQPRLMQEAPIGPSSEALPPPKDRLGASRNRSRRPSPRKTARTDSPANRPRSGLADSTEKNTATRTSPAAGTEAEKDRPSGPSRLDAQWRRFVSQVMEIEQTQGESAAWVKLQQQAGRFGVESCVNRRRHAGASVNQVLGECGPGKL